MNGSGKEPAGADSEPVERDMRESIVSFKTGKFVESRIDAIMRKIDSSNQELRGKIDSSNKEQRASFQNAVFGGVCAIASIVGIAGMILYEVLKRDEEAQQRASRIVFPK